MSAAGVGDDFIDSPLLLKDYKFPGSTPREDTDNEILDLDCLTDDDESWLYSTPAGKVSSTDISAWLRKDADNLDPATRRALAVKLESYLRRKNSAGSIGSESSGLDSGRRSNHIQDQLQIKNGAKTVNRVEKQQLNVSKSLGHGGGGGSSTSRNHGDQLIGKNSDLNLDLKDIQLLASMQEQDLRQCLQQTHLTNRRRATPEHQAVVGTPPKYNGSGLLSGNGLSPLSSFNTGSGTNRFPIDLSATYVKPAVPVKPMNLQSNRNPNVSSSSSSSSVNKTMVSRKISTPGEFKKSPGISAISGEKHIGLRKSLPNLAASRSGDFSLPAHDCNSEKGSYGDIPGVISPAGSSHRVSAGGSRLPTPSRRSASSTNSATPLTKSGIPIPKSRAKSPAPKLSLQTRLIDRYYWNDGCI